MKSEVLHLEADDGIRLLVRRFSPDYGYASQTLVIVHGMSEHGQRYEHVAAAATALGWNVVIPDLRGHGQSGGEHTHVRDFADYLGDLRGVFAANGLSANRTVLVGHSMGGLIAARFVQHFPDSVAALVLLSPLLGLRIRIPQLTVVLGRFLSLVRPRSRFRKRVAPEHTTRNSDALAGRAEDPLIRHSVTASWYFAMRAALRTVWERADSIRCPVLVLQAGADLIVDPDAPRPWLERVTSADKTLRVLPEHYHELLNEVDWPLTLADVLGWLAQRIGATEAPEGLDAVHRCSEHG